MKIDQILNDKIDGVIKFSVDNIFPKYLDLYRNFFCDTEQRKSYVKDRQSNLIVPLMYIVVMTYYSSLFDVVFGFSVSESNPKNRDAKAKKKEEMAKFALTWAFQQSNGKSKMFAALLDCLICNNGYLMSYRHTESSKEAWTDKKSMGAKSEDYMVEYPSLKILSPFKVFFNPMSYGDFYQTPMKVVRDIMPLNDFKHQYRKYVTITSADEAALRTASQSYFLDEDYDARKIKSLYASGYEGDKISTMNEKYIIDDVFVEVIEVRTNYKLRIVVNKNTVYEGANPYPYKKVPLYQITTKEISGTAGSVSMGHILSPLQKTASACLNAYIDEMKLKAVPIVFKTAGATMFKSIDNVTDLEPGKMYTVENKDSVFPMQRGGANIQLQSLLDYLINLGFQSTAMNSYTVGGTGNKVERSAQGVVSRTQILKSQLIPLFQMMNGVMGKIAKMRLAMMKSNLPDGTLLKIFDDKKQANEFKEFSVEDIAGQFDVIFDSEELVNAEKQLNIDNIMKFLGYVGNIATNPATQLPTMDLSKFVSAIAENLGIEDSLVFDTIQKAADYVKEGEEAKLDIQKDLAKKQQEIQQELNPQPVATVEGEQPMSDQDLLAGLQDTLKSTGQEVPNTQPVVEDEGGDLLAEATGNV